MTVPVIPAPRMISEAAASEVDAVGVPAPLGFAEVVARVKPAVVGIQVKLEDKIASDGAQQRKAPSPNRSPLDRNEDQPSAKSGTALGSGFVISGDGYIVTNEHLVSNTKRIEVTSDSGKTYQAKVIGADPQTDLALIKITVRFDVPFVRLTSDPPRIGDWVLAIGNPFGFGGTVTAGIVSANGRDIGGGLYDDFIQIDAPVNLGNSGGPTFNVGGEVIGVNTAIYSPSGGSVGVAFDIPAETVKLIVAQLKAEGRVTRGWIGTQIQQITPLIAETIGLKNEDGALVAHVEPNAPAARGGIERGDVITSVNAETIKEPRDLARKLAVIAPGTSTKIGILRHGQGRTVTVMVGKFPDRQTELEVESQAAPNEAPILGLELSPGVAEPSAGARGVVITDVRSNSSADDSGLQAGDVILEVGHHPVNNPAEVRRLIEETRAQGRTAALLLIKRGNMISFVALPFA
jgi:serine protease Do